MKIGYKGFDLNLSCRGEKFEIGKIYSKTPNEYKEGWAPRICTNEGYHYCTNPEDINDYYVLDPSKSKVCEIEILGPFKDDNNKSVTSSFRIIRELSSNEIIEINKNRLKLELDSALGLDIIKELQIKYPLAVLGGSVALFLYGINLKRLKNGVSDFDLLFPYFDSLHTPLDVDGNELTFKRVNGKNSGNDFDESFTLVGKDNFYKIDYKIYPQVKYNIIEYNGFNYKVCPLFDIIEAKMKYAKQGNNKHREDMLEIFNINDKIQEQYIIL